MVARGGGFRDAPPRYGPVRRRFPAGTDHPRFAADARVHMNSRKYIVVQFAPGFNLGALCVKTHAVLGLPFRADPDVTDCRCPGYRSLLLLDILPYQISSNKQVVPRGSPSQQHQVWQVGKQRVFSEGGANHGRGERGGTSLARTSSESAAWLVSSRHEIAFAPAGGCSSRARSAVTVTAGWP